MKTIVVGAVAAILGFAAIITLQGEIDHWRDDLQASQEIMYVPSGNYLKPAVLGYDTVVADLLWIRGLMMFGEHHRRSDDPTWYEFFARIVDVSSDLDPLEAQIYLKGGVLLRNEPTMVEHSNRILEKGIKNVDHFFIPFARGMNSLEFDKDYEQAAKYIQIAANRPDAPFYISRLAATIMTDGGQLQAAHLFLQEQLKATPPDTLQYTSTASKLRDVQYQIIQSQLTEARSRFQSLFGRDPSPLSEMVGVTIKGSTMPPDPYGGKWVLGEGGGAIYSNMREKVLFKLLRETGVGLAPRLIKQEKEQARGSLTPDTPAGTSQKKAQEQGAETESKTTPPPTTP